MTPQKGLGDGREREGKILIKTLAIKEMKLEYMKLKAQIMGNGAEPSYISIEFQAVPISFYLYSQKVEPVSTST